MAGLTQQKLGCALTDLFPSFRSQVSTLQGIGQDCVVVLPGGCRSADTQPVFFNFTTLDSTISLYWMERWEVGVPNCYAP